MPRYRVVRAVVEGYEALVEADNEEDAEKLMDDLEEDDWDLTYCDEKSRVLCGEVDDECC